MVHIIGAPFDLCGLRLGSRLGPAAVRLAGLEEALAALGLVTEDCGDIPVDLHTKPTDGLKNFDHLFNAIKVLQQRVVASLDAGALPVVLGGEHTLAVAGVSAALKRHASDRFGALWIDAHADVNTPGSSPTGNIHGMPLAALWGASSEIDGPANAQWSDLLELLGPTRLDPHRTAWLGLRDVDPSERPRLLGLPLTMHDVDLAGMKACVEHFCTWATGQGIEALWVSFDVDALDPILAPGTGTAVRGGLTYREAHLLAELLHSGLQSHGIALVGVDLVETNPLVDTNNETAQMAVEWIASLFGKTILGPLPGGVPL